MAFIYTVARDSTGAYTSTGANAEVLVSNNPDTEILVWKYSGIYVLV